jgi:hypothetical protein
MATSKTTLKLTQAASRKQLSTTLSRRLANHRLRQKDVDALAERMTVEGLVISGFHPCIYGICIDYHATKLPDLNQLANRGFTRFEVFPYGIIDWDHFHVKVGMQVDQLEGKLQSHGLGL